MIQWRSRIIGRRRRAICASAAALAVTALTPVSYTHLTLPTIYSV